MSQSTRRQREPSETTASASADVRPFDAVLVIAFGGPEGVDDIRPFLENVLRGRRIPPERIESVAHHYELFDGVSPLPALTRKQADGLDARLRESGLDLPVYVGMRNWHPLLPDTLRGMAEAGIRRAIGFIAAPHRSYSSCLQYRLNVDQARRELTSSGMDDIELTYVGDWHTSDGFIEANAGRIESALATMPADVAAGARLIFTAHSIPLSMAEAYPYRRQIEESARLIAGRLGRTDWMIAYQSRSGRPEDPWLEPDISDALRATRGEGVRGVVVSPIGFLCDHIEVLYNLDREAAGTAEDIGLVLARAGTVNDHPAFLDMMADQVQRLWKRYAGGFPLPIVAAASDKTEPPPPRR